MSRDDDPTAKTKSAVYGGYANNFSDNFFVHRVARSVRNIKRQLGENITTLEWGEYQKYAPDDPNDKTQWDQNGSGGAVLYDNWEAAVDEAREDLAMLPRDNGVEGPDPDDPVNSRKSTMLEHLDHAVTVALLKKYQVGNNPPNSGIPIHVEVDHHASNWRRHWIRTIWERNNNADRRYNCKKLTIRMTCPSGGWIGTALWKDYDGSQGDFTRYTSTYAVPQSPTRTDYGQVIFIFNGLESIPDGINVPAILQPVLQWTPEGGGTWAVRSWYVPASYRPSFAQMPALNNAKPFTDANTPAWTVATQVYPGDMLQGIIEQNGALRVSKFQKSGQIIAELMLNDPSIAKLTYPVAVIEAYMPPGGPRRVPRDGLVESVFMANVTLTCQNGIPQPEWDTGRDVGASAVQGGTNNLKRYRTVARFDAKTGTSTIRFTLKNATPNPADPAWEGTEVPE